MGGPPTTVLVVDDEEIVRETCVSMLESLGFATLTARDGREGVEALARAGDRVSAVVLDLTMPVMSGADAFDAMRASRPDLPILVTSGYYPPEVAERLGAQPRCHFLRKPYTVADLGRALQALLAT